MLHGWSHRSLAGAAWQLAALVAVWCALGVQTARADDAAHFQAYHKQIQPLLARYCIDCHGGGKPEADLSLEGFTDDLKVAAATDVWLSVRDYLEAGYMPPEDATQPTPEEREQMTAWVRAELARAASQAPPSPGRVTLRRLNRAEYNNTVRDLVGIDFQPADDFPADDVGYGFDNIGDVLSMSPVLMERYMAAAQQIVERAIVVPVTARSETVSYRGVYLKRDDGQEQPSRKDSYHWLSSEGAISMMHAFPHSGTYRIRAGAYGDQAGDEPVRMALLIDGRQVHEFEVTADSSKKPGKYEVDVPVEAGKRKISLAFTNDYYDPDHKDPGQRDRNLAVGELVVIGPSSVAPPELPESHRRIFIAQPGSKMSDEAAARAILERFAQRAWRRPVEKDELQRLLALYDAVEEQDEPFERCIQVAVQAVLVSPHFLFRVERDAPGSQGERPHLINEYELASRLSYFLWSSMPDDALLEQAKAGALRKNLDSQVRRMLYDPKAKALIENFAGQWLETRNLALVELDPKLFPHYDEELRAAMIRESELFFEAIVREDRSLLELLAADFTFVNERLARHYGMEGVRGSTFQCVKTDGTRGGVVTQAAVLTLTSNSTRTSPVKRGKWILDNILGTPPPPPPPDVPELAEGDEQLRGTLRQQLEQHRTNAVCNSCHSRMDPLGFGLENFDASGAWRTRDGRHAIDASGTLPSGESFNGPRELQQVLLDNRAGFVRCFSEKMLTYALGRGLAFYDQPAVDELVAEVESGGYRFSELVLAIAGSRPFQMRAPQQESP